MAERKRSYVQWWMVLGGGTLLLLFYNSPWMRVYYPEIYRLKYWVFGLPLEDNFAVWWSAAIYLLSAALFYEIASGESPPRRRPYYELSFLMLAVVIDEIGGFHEWLSGIGGWTALGPFGLLMVLLLGDSLFRLWREPGRRPVFWLVLIGFLVLGTVPVQEYAEHNLTSRSWSEWWGRFYEESTELVGASIILVGAVYRRQGRGWGGSLAAAVPDPARMVRLVPIVTVGFLAHLAAIQTPLIKVGRWAGTPSAIYPMVVFFLLACYAFWVPVHRAEEGGRFHEIRGFWSGVGLFFLACSVGTLQNLWGLFGQLVPGLGKRWFYEKVSLYIGLLLVAAFIGLSLWRRNEKRLLWLLALPLSMVIRLRLPHPGRKHLAAGLFALICCWALLRFRQPETSQLPSDSARPT